MLITPRINSKGYYSSTYTYGIKSKVIYTLVAVTSYRELLIQGVELLNKYYLQVGLEDKDYQQDLKAGASLLTITDGINTLNVPNTRLDKYPLANIVDYSRRVLSLSLGELPTALPLEHVIEIVSTQIHSALGQTVDIKVHDFNLPEAVSLEEHEILERARKLKITQSDSLYVQLQKEKATSASLREKIAVLERYIRESKVQ